MLVNSIDPLAPYKVSDDLILELVNVTATVEDDLDDASVGTWWFRLWSLTHWSNTNGRETADVPEPIENCAATALPYRSGVTFGAL